MVGVGWVGREGVGQVDSGAGGEGGRVGTVAEDMGVMVGVDREEAWVVMEVQFKPEAVQLALVTTPCNE